MTGTAASPDCVKGRERRAFAQGRSNVATLMPLARRGFAALSGLLLLQLVLLGSGTLCTMRHEMQNVGASDHAMQMSGASRLRSVQEGAASDVAVSDLASSPADSSGTSDHDGCRLPLAPGQCTSMSACSVNAAPSEMGPVSVSGRVVEVAPVTTTRGPSGPAFAPELPPPRV